MPLTVDHFTDLATHAWLSGSAVWTVYGLLVVKAVVEGPWPQAGNYPDARSTRAATGAH